MPPQARTLSEQEFKALQARVLAGAPDSLSEADFQRYIGPAMEQALGEAENLPVGGAYAPLGKAITSTLPALGGMFGMMAGAPAGPAGGIAGAGLGAGAGRGAQDLIDEALGIQPESSPLSKAGRIGVDTAISAGTAALAPGIAEAFKTPRQSLAELYQTYRHPLKAVDSAVETMAKPATGAILRRPAWQTWPASESTSAAASSADDGLAEMLRKAGVGEDAIARQIERGASVSPVSGGSSQLKPPAPATAAPTGLRKYTDRMTSPEPTPPWHANEIPGSAEAAGARRLHISDSGLDASWKRILQQIKENDVKMGVPKPPMGRTSAPTPVLNKEMLDKLFQQANPTFKKMNDAGAFSGDRSTISEALLNALKYGRGK